MIAFHYSLFIRMDSLCKRLVKLIEALLQSLNLKYRLTYTTGFVALMGSGDY